MGGVESSAALCRDAVTRRHGLAEAAGAGAVPSAPPIFCYSACDNMKLAQLVLKSHTAHSRPRHLFADVTHRVSSAVRHTLQQYLAQGIQDYAAEASHIREEACEATAKKRMIEAKAGHGYRMLERMTRLLDTLEFDRTDTCLQCGTECFLNPRQAGHERDLWIEGAGATCAAFAQGRC